MAAARARAPMQPLEDDRVVAAVAQRGTLARGSGAQPTLFAEPIDVEASAGQALVFQAPGDLLRLVSLIGVRQGSEVCVCDLTAAFDRTQPTISHHIKILGYSGPLDGTSAESGSATGHGPRRWRASGH